jgi:hypothetical protein
MSFLLRDFEAFLKNDSYTTWSDFDHYVTADSFTTVASNSGTVAVADGTPSFVRITPSDGSVADNDESYMKGTTEIYKFATGKPFFMAAKVRPWSTTLLETNLIVGIKDAVAADTLVDTGGGPPSSYSGAVFYKVDGGTKWVCESSIATTQTTVTSDHTVGNNSWDILAIEVLPISSTESEVHFFSGDVGTAGDYKLTEVGLDNDGTKFFVQTITHTSATEMQLCFGVKNGAATNTNLLDVDWCVATQKR